MVVGDNREIGFVILFSATTYLPTSFRVLLLLTVLGLLLSPLLILVPHPLTFKSPSPRPVMSHLLLWGILPVSDSCDLGSYLASQFHNVRVWEPYRVYMFNTFLFASPVSSHCHIHVVSNKARHCSCIKT